MAAAPLVATVATPVVVALEPQTAFAASLEHEERASFRSAGAAHGVVVAPNRCGNVQLKRLFRNRAFLRAWVVPNLSLGGLARAATVCKRWRDVAYLPDVLAECIAAGGVEDCHRGRLWSVLVGVAPPTAGGLPHWGVMSAAVQCPFEPDCMCAPPPAAQLAAASGKGMVVVSAETLEGEVVGELDDSVASWETVDVGTLGPACIPNGNSDAMAELGASDASPARSRRGTASAGSDTDASSVGSRTARTGGRRRLKLGIFGGSASTGGAVAPRQLSASSVSPEPSGAAAVVDAAAAARRNLAVAGLRGGNYHNRGGAAPPRVERVPGLYAALLASADATDEDDFRGSRGPKRVSFADIEKDLHRTLGVTDVTALRHVLRCLSLDSPDVGYVQGMNFLCRLVLQSVNSEEDCYWVMAAMMGRFGLKALFGPGMPGLQLRYFQLQRLMQWHLPALYERFQEQGVTPNLYATPWFVTLLSDGSLLPEPEVLRLWDLLFLYCGCPALQWAVVFRVVLELLARAAPRLLQASFDETVQRLMSLPFMHLCGAGGLAGLLASATARFENSFPMQIQLQMLYDDWERSGEPDRGWM